MKFQKTITLISYQVEYIDKRQPKPRAIRREMVVLDGGRVDALQRLGIRPAGYIAQQFEREGYTVTDVRRGDTLHALVDLTELWSRTTQAIALERTQAQLQAALEKLGSIQGAVQTELEVPG